MSKWQIRWMLPPGHFLIKTSFSCKMTNYVFKVTNHLIKIYKRLNTVWPRWRLLSWITFRGGIGFPEKPVPNHHGTLNTLYNLFTVVILSTSSSSWQFLPGSKRISILLKRISEFYFILKLYSVSWIFNITYNVQAKCSSILRENS